MKTLSQFVIKSLLPVMILALLPGCADLFENPLKDKKTGEDINLLIVDLNFFKTRITFKFLDATTGKPIENATTITFTGKNKDDIVTFSGEKKPQFETLAGQFELTLDPTVGFSESQPFEFAVNVSAEGYQPMSKGVQFAAEGKKTVEVFLAKTTGQDDTQLEGEINFGENDTTFVFGIAQASPVVKSASADEKNYQINYSVSMSSLLKFKNSSGNFIFSSSDEAIAAYNANPDNFFLLNFSTYSTYPSWIDVLNGESVVFHILETGELQSVIIAGTTVADLNGGTIASTCAYTGSPAPDIFGFAVFQDSNWNLAGVDTTYTQLNFQYTLIEASGETLCPSGSAITFTAEFESSFSITADVYDMQDKLITSINFTGNFPETFNAENVPPIPVKLVFRSNNPGFSPIPDLLIDNFCAGSYTVSVGAAAGFTEYQIVLKAFCPDDPTVAVAPTYSGEFRIAGSADEWQGAYMIGGVVNILARENQEYQYRLLWEEEWEYMTMHTTFNADGSYPYPEEALITSETLPDGRIRINISHTFKQSVCDTMNW